MLSFPTRTFLLAAALGIDLNQLATLHQALQAFGEFLTSGAMQSQFPHQLFEASGAFRLAFDLLQNGGIGESIQDQAASLTRIIIRDRIVALLSLHPSRPYKKLHSAGGITLHPTSCPVHK